MKVVLFCGGFGLRMRERPTDGAQADGARSGHDRSCWHVMKYYAHYGHTEFILCLGYQAEVIKQYFFDDSEAISNDFVLSERRADGRAADARHRRLADHVRRHGPARQHR